MSLDKLIKVNDVEGVIEALESGADPNSYPGRESWEFTPLMLASYHRLVDIVQVLLDYGADPNMTTSGGGSTALRTAVLEANKAIASPDPEQLGYFHSLAVIQSLLENGADPNMIYTNTIYKYTRGSSEMGLYERSTTTVLHAAAVSGNILVVQLLLDHGADPSIRNDQGLLPVDLTTSQEIRDLLNDPRYQPVPWTPETHHRLSRAERMRRVAALSALGDRATRDALLPPELRYLVFESS